MIYSQPVMNEGWGGPNIVGEACQVIPSLFRPKPQLQELWENGEISGCSRVSIQNSLSQIWQSIWDNFVDEKSVNDV